VNFLSLIEAKRDGRTLEPAQIKEFVTAYAARRIPDYQVAALLMAIYFRGLTTAETTALTLAMRDSGDVLKFPPDPRPLVDKHSTGGIGDKVSLPLAPLLACLGFRVPMISGRGLGITGGTLDKLDSIPGFSTLLPAKRITEIVQEVGCIICGQTDTMVPADKALYALRDVTATVPSIPLIVASILSKKLAESLDALVLDVKFGRAAFMPTRDKARELAKALVELSSHCGVRTRALITNMETPLGRAAGNWLEVKESIACLSQGALRGPCCLDNELAPDATHSTQHAAQASLPGPGLEPVPADLCELVIACAAHLLVQTGKCPSLGAARAQTEACLASGKPRVKWDEMLAAQGADPDAVRQKLTRDHTAAVVMDLKAPSSGRIADCDARILGEVVRELGGGRLTKESVLNYDVGVDRLVKPGEPVQRGAALARIHAATQHDAEAACARLQTAFKISAEPPVPPPLIAETLEGSLESKV